MGEMRDSDWSRENLLRSDWLLPKGAIMTTHGFGQKFAIFPCFFFKGNIGQENVFYDILERGNPFLGYKNKKFTQWKNCHFCKRVSYGFGSKLFAFPFFF